MYYVALLRGINVGGNNKVEMKKLKSLFESLGYTNVSTYINSGNVVFETKEKDADMLAETIEQNLKKHFGFAIQVMVRSNKKIMTLVGKIPKEWENNTMQKTDVLFLSHKYDNKKSLLLLTPTKEVDNLIYTPGAIIWNIKRDNYSKSGMRKFIGTELYKDMTARNVNTVRKLALLVGEK